MRSWFGVWLLAGCLVAPPVWAAEADKQEEGKTVTKAEAITVTAGRIEQSVLDVTVPVQIISAEEIRAAGVDNLGDLLGKYMTGHLTKYTGVLTSVGIRGFRTEAHGDDVKGYVLILVDGHRTGTGNAVKIDVERIERVEILKGPYSSLYGSAAMGGVVNLITKKGDHPLGAQVNATYGSFDYLNTGLSGGGRVDDKFRFYINTSYKSQGDVDTPDFGQQKNTAYHIKNLGWNATYQFSPSHDLRWGGNMAEIGGAYDSWSNGTYSSYADTSQNFDKSNRYSDLEYNGRFLDGFLNVRSLFYYLWDRNQWKYGTPDPDLTGTKYTDTTIGWDQQFNFNFGKWSNLVAGFTLEQLEKKSEAISGGSASAPYTPGMEYNTLGLFAQDTISLFDDRVNLVLAGRYDRFDLKTKKPDSGDFPLFKEKSETFDEFSPKAGVAYNFLDKLMRVRANLGMGFKSPSPDQLSAQYRGHNGVGYLGNPDLKPETSLTWDLGWDLFHRIADLELTYWHSDYKDKIISASKMVRYDNQDWYTWENHGEAEIAGVDFNANLRLSEIMKWKPNLSLHTRVTFYTKFEDKETGSDLVNVSDYEAKSWINFSHKGFSTSLFYVLIGPESILNYDYSPARTETKEAFDFWDYQASYSFLKNWRVTLNVYNLADRRYEWVRGYPMPERSYHLGLTYEF